MWKMRKAGRGLSELRARNKYRDKTPSDDFRPLDHYSSSSSQTQQQRAATSPSLQIPLLLCIPTMSTKKSLKAIRDKITNGEPEGALHESNQLLKAIGDKDPEAATV